MSILNLIHPCVEPPFLPSHTNVDAAKSFFLNCSPPNTPPISYSRECIFPTDSNMKCENLRFFLICFFKINQERQKRLPLGYLAFSQLHLPGISSVLVFDIAATDENEGSRPFDVAATSDEERVNRVPHLCHSLSWNHNGLVTREDSRPHRELFGFLYGTWLSIRPPSSRPPAMISS